MADSVSDGQNRLVYHNDTETLYRVTIPSGWVSNHGNQLDSTGEWRWGDLYQESHGDLPELPDNIKARFDLNGPLPVPVQERARDDEAPAVVEKRVRYVEGAERREPDEDDLFGARGIGRRGGKSKKRPTRRVVHPRLAKLASPVRLAKPAPPAVGNHFFLKNPNFGFGFAGAPAVAVIHSCIFAASHVI